MNRLLIHVEGQTEETFVNEVLAPHLYSFGFRSIGARLMGNSRIRGGVPSWGSAKTDFVRHLKEDPRCCHTTMVDYYGMPRGEGRAWPGRIAAVSRPYAEKAATVEQAIFEDLRLELEDILYPDQFLPFVLMHEFEGLLFSDCDRFGEGIGRLDLISSFQAIRDQFDTPEEINDSPVTAPSKRIISLLPGYEKPLFGSLASLEIGLDAMKAECPNFRMWLSRLEQLPQTE
ncbi:MAG: DUF4276 family protein [Prosthecobacter sp.]